jgi:hypothetical protein
MAISIQAQLAKKVPIPGSQFSSQQASITVTAEVTDLNQVVAEAQRLYQIAEQAVDAQLNRSQNPTPTAQPVVGPNNQPQQATAQTASSPRQTSQPYRGNNQHRRGPAPVTDSQMRFLKRLIDQSKASVPAILNQFQIGDLSQLSCRDAAQLIDELKQVSA